MIHTGMAAENLQEARPELVGQVRSTAADLVR